MELKRYVLGIEKGIIDTKGTEYYIWERNKLCSGGGGVLDIILKTSDNILDLVEMADLVEVDYLNGLLNINGSEVRIHKIELVQLVVKDISGKTKIIIDMTEDSNKTVKPECVIAIYKRQPNGDYKRYEVK